MKINPIAARLLVIALLALMPLAACADMAQTFRQPPPSARPWSFWFWINGNITKEGITADLEAMSRVGIGGVLIMEVANPKTMAPAGPVKFASPEWDALFQHALKEAKRLGMQVNMNNDAGWCGSGGPWITPEQSMKMVVVTTATVTGPKHVEMTLAQPQTVEGFYRDLEVCAVPQAEAGSGAGSTSAPASGAIKITDHITSDGRVSWDAPSGNWILARIGYTSTGKMNRPAPVSGLGLECDKFDATALKGHFDAFISKLVDQNTQLAGKTFVSTHIDSWEVGPQTWTKKMPEEFQKRRGYDITPWLPVLAGLEVGTPAEMERFQRDFTLTCAELNNENYAGELRKLANEKGLQLSIEAYGQSGFLNPLDYGGEADMPVSEFWISRWDAWHLLSPRLMASVAHVLGKPLVGAESFTSMPDKDPFTEYPFSVKSTGDWAMCEGVNHIIFHRTVHDPWPGSRLVPGMSFAGYGWHVDRKQTWFDQSVPFMKYLARCQSILQSGKFVADVCRLVPDGETRGNTRGMHQIPDQYEALPAGYNFDYISDKALISEISVKEGRLVTRSGMSYNALQLPRYTTMSLGLARKVAELVSAGATIIGPKPTTTPGLTNYPVCDQQLREIADKAWDTAAPHHVISEKKIGDALAGRIPADFTYVIDPPVAKKFIKSITGRSVKKAHKPAPKEMPTQGLNWIHRKTAEGDFYFVANPQYREVNALCTFRASNMAPELWDPSTGEIRSPYIFKSGENVQLPIHFGPAGSVFVVFRKMADASSQIVEVKHGGITLFGEGAKPSNLPIVAVENGKQVLEGGQSGHYELKFANGKMAVADVPQIADSIPVKGPWKVTFQKDRGAPASTDFQQLADWSKSDQEGIKYFSGTATYHTSFNIDAASSGSVRWKLELGKVLVMARVRLNGKDLGVLWKEPFSLDVTDSLKPGANELEVEVTNLWPNRMIGDEQYPDDSSADGKWVKGALKAWPDWVKDNTPRPEPRRITFTTYKYYQKNSPLIPSGLLGPVKLEAVRSYPLAMTGN